MHIKRNWILIVGTIFLIATVYYALGKYPFAPSKGELLARQYCGSCHQFPDPSLLDKKIWVNAVLPQMAFRMGFKEDKILYGTSLKELPIIRSVIPSKPMISEEDLQLIKEYYEKAAPNLLEHNSKLVYDSTTLFTPEAIKGFRKPCITLLEYDSITSQLFVGDATGGLSVFNKTFHLLDTLQLASPATCLEVTAQHNLIVSTIGSLMPSDLATGNLLEINGKSKATKKILDSLQRPVNFYFDDLDQDHIEELIVCLFGNYTGSLEIYKNSPVGYVKQTTLANTPGTRKIAVTDWDHDGKKDIIALMAQGDERLLLYKNKGGLKYEEILLVRFPPVYGSSFFELVDFNKDGWIDILYTNGDNADYTYTVKPYHSVKIFEHNAAHNVTEKWSYPLPGAWQAKAIDFDLDGDLDIATISLFPDDVHERMQTFMYFENKGGQYKYEAKILPSLNNCKWMVMETFDFDDDGDDDIVLGSFNLEQLRSRKNSKKQTPTTLVLLKNNQTVLP